MKQVQTLIKIAGSICWLFVQVAVALWALTWIIQLVRQLRDQLSNKMVIRGTIV